MTCIVSLLLSSLSNAAMTTQHTQWKIIGDNADLSIRVRDMRLDSQDQSVHIFHVLALKDRIDTSHLDNSSPQCSVSRLNVSDFVPSQVDYADLRKTLIVLMARVVVAELPAFELFKSAVPKHIIHSHSSEMATESHVVSIIIMT